MASALSRERKTIEVMIGIYCRGVHHRDRGRCAECEELLKYADLRIDKCLFKDDKPTCASCPVHCYKPAMRTRIREVMRYAGPRMSYRHPVLAFLHFLVSRKPAVENPKRRGAEPSPECCATPPGAGSDTDSPGSAADR